MDLVAAGRAAIQRRAPPVSEAVALPGGLPVFAAAADEGNKVLQEAAPIGLLQVCNAACSIALHSVLLCPAPCPDLPYHALSLQIYDLLLCVV